MKDFQALGLSAPILEGLQKMGFKSPTEIQEQSIPILLEHTGDFIGLAQTGTGKTAAFGIPLAQLVDVNSKHVQALILAPTRELAQQITGQLSDITQQTGKLNIVSVYGGASIQHQIKDIRRGAQIIVATPGRLMDLMKRNVIALDKLSFMVLDEADEMLNMGFKEDIDFILSKSDMGRQIWLFSATMPKEIQRIVNTYMRDPREVKINRKNVVNTDIEHQYVQLKASDKTEALRRFMDYDDDMYGVVFCRTKRDTQRVADDLNNTGYSSEPLHGDMSQAQRDAVMRRFRDKNIKLLIATDVAARGIDVNDLTHVVHFALPDDPEFYTHRSGRTARAGKKGISLALVTKGDIRRLRFLEKKLGIDFNKAEVPALNAIISKRIKRWSDNLVNQEISGDITDDLFYTVQQAFEDVSKDQLIGKLITRELEAIKRPNSIKDLNDKSKPSSRKKDDRGREEGMKTFFVNLGKVDNLNTGSLLGMVCEVTGISGKDFGRIVMDKKHSFMDVAENEADKMQKLDGFPFNGRQLRANLHKGRVPRSGGGKHRKGKRRR